MEEKRRGRKGQEYMIVTADELSTALFVGTPSEIDELLGLHKNTTNVCIYHEKKYGKKIKLRNFFFVEPVPSLPAWI